MAANSSSFSHGYYHHCADSAGGTLTLIAFIIINFFLFLPLSIFILHLGVQRWRQRGSSAAASYSDVFTYHWAALELIYVLGFTCYFCGKFSGVTELMAVGYYLLSTFHPGQMCLHVLTCVERYLAVVHPVSYLQLRRSGGLRVRNVSAGCVWLLVCGWMGLEGWSFPDVPYVAVFCLMVASIALVTSCSLSVLRVLIHPGPGEMRGRREQSDPSKKRAFHTITAIMAVLWLFFAGLLTGLALDKSSVLAYGEGCLLLMSTNWFGLPSSLVLPLLFLHRAGKLLCCQCSHK